MQTRNRNRMATVALAVTTALFLAVGAGCGGSETLETEKDKTVPPKMPIFTTVPYAPRVVEQNPLVPGKAVSSMDQASAYLTCELPAGPPESPLFSDPKHLVVKEYDDRFCFDALIGQDHCVFVTQHERRYRAVVECHQRALHKLDQLAEKALHRVETQGPWAKIRSHYLPPVWAMTPAQASEGVGFHAGMIAKWLGAKDKAIWGRNFCFAKDAHTPLKKAKAEALSSLRSLWQFRELMQSVVYDALKKGVDVQLDPAQPEVRVQLKVKFKEVYPKQVWENQDECTFAPLPRKS